MLNFLFTLACESLQIPEAGEEKPRRSWLASLTTEFHPQRLYLLPIGYFVRDKLCIILGFSEESKLLYL